VARLIKISYGGLTVGLGGNASITLTDKFRCASSYTEFSLTFECVVRNATRSTFLTAESALAAAFTQPDGDLDVELGGSDRFAFAHASNTGFNARATCEKVGGPEDTANSSRWRCSVTVQLPADLSGRSGRQTSAVSVDAGPNGVRTVTIDGTYTALSSNSAVAQYVAAGDTYCSGVLTAIGGTYELLTPHDQSGAGFSSTGDLAAGFRYDDQNKVLSFRRVYQEVIYRQSLSETDNAAIKRPSLTVERTTPTNDSDTAFTARPLEALRVTYAAEIDKNESTDLDALYRDTIRPLMLAEANTVAGSTVVVNAENYGLNRTGNGVTATMDVVAELGAEFIRAVLTIEDLFLPGETFADVWSGDPYEVDLYKVPARHFKTVIRDTVMRKGATLDPRRAIPVLQGFREVQQFRRETRGGVGSAADRLGLESVTHSFVFRRVNVSTSAGTSSGGGGNVGSTQTRTGPEFGLPA